MNYAKALTTDILPIWLNYGMDLENGGIYTCPDEKGNRYGTEKAYGSKVAPCGAFPRHIS